MAMKKFKPTTPGQRNLILPKNETLTRKEGLRQTVKPCKKLLSVKKKTGGRNHHGHITCRHRGGGHRRFYRLVDFTRDKVGIKATVASIEYDPNRSAHLALLHYVDGEKRYIIAPEGLKVGQIVTSGPESEFEVGNCMALKDMPVGSTVHNIELYPGRGAKLIRSAGLSGQLMARSNGYATIKMPSGEVRMINEKCHATFGAVSNAEFAQRVEGKAGRTRWKGIRPTVRGTAMNPVDHPHGGGEGRHNGYIPQTPWGLQTKGKRTRAKNKTTNKWIVKRSKKK